MKNIILNYNWKCSLITKVHYSLRTNCFGVYMRKHFFDGVSWHSVSKLEHATCHKKYYKHGYLGKIFYLLREERAFIAAECKKLRLKYLLTKGVTDDKTLPKTT